MSAIAQPYGFQPISGQSGTPRTQRIPNGIASGLAQNIFKYQPVTISPVTGTIIPVTNPGGIPQRIFGIMMGVEYTPLGGRPAESPFWPSGTVIDPNLDFFVYIAPAWLPDTRFRVQADGAVAQALLASQFNGTNVAAGSTSTGLGTATVGAAGVAAGGQGQWALVEFDTAIGDLIGDAFTDLIVTTCFPQVGFGSQPSIG